MAATEKRLVRELVLVGGGHSHVQVLKRFAMEPPPDTHITVVVDTPIAVYSGMVPGFAAGQYKAAELEIDVLPLARRAQARFIHSRVVGIDAEAKRIQLTDRPPITYDVASIDIGSTVAGLELPGIRQHAFPTRPIGLFVRRFEEVLTQARAKGAGERLDVLVVGGGVGGMELAFSFKNRLARESQADAQVTLVHRGERLLQGLPAGLARKAEAAARRLGIEIRCGAKVTAAAEGQATLEDGTTLPADVLVWVTGAVSQSIFRDSGLPTDDRGFVLTRKTLQVVGHEDLYAVGDCATMQDYPELPKAGVYAVRQGPYLIDNLRATLFGGKPRHYRPQRDFLALLNLGDGTALGSKWGLAFAGRWVMRLKDWIDRRFMDKFQVLESDGALTETFASVEMAEMEMLCGGCAAKVGQSVLDRALARLPPRADDPSVVMGLDVPDDASAFRTSGGEVVAQSVDAFRGFTDDPYLVGWVAAVNSVSDLLAKGVGPNYALALVALPEDDLPEVSEELLYQILCGIRAVLDPLGITLLGGHTTTAPELIVGLSVDAVVPTDEPLLAITGLEAGQALILSKALGTGVLFHADMQGRLRGPWFETAIASMVRTNADAARIARECGAGASTDITGFGFVGHLAEMVRASDLSAVVDIASLPALPGSVELMEQGLRSTFHPENAKARRGIIIRREAAVHPKLDLLFDPQTSGGLLFGVPQEQAAEAIERLRQAGDGAAAIVGRIVPAREDGSPIEVLVEEETPT